MAIALLAGVPLTLDAGVEWSLTYGATPYVRTFHTTKTRAEAILKASRNKTVQLVLDPDNGTKPVSIYDLSVLHTVPSDENNLGLVVADKRWTLARKSVTRDYNVRRTTGEYRRVGTELQEIQIKGLVADVAFQRASLHGGARWTPWEIIADVLEELFPGEWKIEGQDFSIDVEGLVLNMDRGDSAMSRILGYFPGARMFVTPRGVVTVTNSLDGDEDDAVKAAPARYRALPGHIEKVDRANIRPPNVYVEFEPEPELRFDYDEDATLQTWAPDRAPRHLENVIPVVDPELTLNGKKVTEGTWLSVHNWITAVNNQDDAPARQSPQSGSMEALSIAQFRKHYMSGFQLMRNNYVAAWTGNPDPVWERRIAAIASHFRQSFRIISQYMDKLRGVISRRGSVLDQETGSLGKAEAWFDYFVIPSRRTINKQNAHTKNLGYNVDGYAALITGARSSPVNVVIDDPQAGIFHLAWRPDPWGDAASMVPGHVDDEDLAKATIVAGAKLLSGVSLLSGWKMSVILTAYVATPNNSNRLYTVTVPTGEALALLPGVKQSTRSWGPSWTIGIGSGVDTARFLWLDSESAAIDDAVYGDRAEGGRWKKELLTNREATDSIARATAARIHSLLLDRWEGSQFVPMNPDLVPVGSMSRVSHAILGNGSPVTRMVFPPITQGPDIYSMLPDSVRKIIQKQVQQ